MTVRAFRVIRLFFHRAFRIAMANPRTTLACFAITTLACFAMLPRLRMELRIYDIDDPHFVSIEKLRRFSEEFNDGNSVFLLARKHDGSPFSTGEFCRIEDWKENQHRSNPEVVSASSPADVLVPELTGVRLRYRRLLEAGCGSASLTADRAARPLSFASIRESPWGEVLTDPSGRDFAMQFTFRDTETTDKGRFNPDVVGKLLGDFKTHFSAAGVDVYLGGRAGFQWYQKQAIVKDLWVNALLIGLLILLFRLFCGTWISGIALVGTLLASITITYGGMSLLGLPVDTLSNSLFLMLCMAGMEDFVFLSCQHLAHPGCWRRNFKAVLVPGFFTSFTTVIGFLSLCTSDIHLISRFGLCAAFAALIEWAVTFFALPALIAALGWNGNWTRAEKAPILALARKLGALELPRPASLVALALAAASLLAFPFLRFDSSPRAFFPKGHPQRATYEYTESSRGWEAILLVILNSARPEDKAANERLLERIAMLPNIAHVDDPYDVPRFMSRGLPEPIAQLVRREVSLTRAYSRIFSDSGRARASIYVKDFDLGPLEQTLSDVRAICGDHCEAVGEGAVFAEYSEQVVRTMFLSFFTCLVLTGLVLAFLVRATGGSARETAAVLFSSFWAPIVVLGALAALRIPINYFNSMFATVLVGLTGDNAVQYLLARGGLAAGIREKAHASVAVACISIVAGFCFFLMTPVPIRLLGVLLSLGFLASLTGDLWLLRGLLKALPRSPRKSLLKTRAM